MARDEILSYIDMCQRQGLSLQRGMNFFQPPAVSVVLMNRRRNAPYDDEMSEDGTELVYEGHDVPRSAGVDPKRIDQPWATATGTPTENAKFARATERAGTAPLVRVYEKLQQGIWSDKGLFELVQYEYKESNGRKVFKFHMRSAVDQEATGTLRRVADGPMTRIIPGWVKQQVYKRDKGKCVMCGAKDQLHFDHDLPYSRGGTGLTPANVRILCARHNLAKGARIE